MPYIVIEKPEIMTISYRQTENDDDYGSCLWARFYFDKKNYHLSIESDCGNFSYGWRPTPDSETFLHLCSRFDSLYLLNKISLRCVIDETKTFENIKEFLRDYDEENYEQLSRNDFENLNIACSSYRESCATINEIQSVLDRTGFSGSCCDYDIGCCIEKDYPCGAKKIAEVFHEHIQPIVKKLAKEETDEG